MLRSLYNWTMRQAAGRHAPWAMGIISFTESSFFPLPPDIVLAPLVVARPEKAWRYATICTLASVAGGILGYAIGYFLTDLGLWLLRMLGQADGLQTFQRFFDEWGLWVILIKGLTPVPYKLVTIASGLAEFPFWIFVLASLVTRGGRFFLVAWVVKTFGPAILPIVERRLYLVGGTVVVLLVAGVLALRFLG